MKRLHLFIVLCTISLVAFSQVTPKPPVIIKKKEGSTTTPTQKPVQQPVTTPTTTTTTTTPVTYQPYNPWEDRSFIMLSYHHDITAFGFSYGKIKETGVGFYLGAKLNLDLIESFGAYTVDDTGETDAPSDILIASNQFKEGAAQVSLGLTVATIYPVWLSLGGGVGYYPRFEEYEGFSSDFNGGYISDGLDYYENTDQSTIEGFPEVGVNVNIGYTIILQYNFMYARKAAFHGVGLGFQI